MSIQYYATTVVGILVIRRDLFKKELRRGCDHQEHGDPYCSMCGKRPWVKKIVPIEGYNPDDPSYKGLDVISPRCGSDYLILGIVTGKVCDKDELRATANSDHTKAWAEAREELMNTPFKDHPMETYTVYYSN